MEIRVDCDNLHDARSRALQRLDELVVAGLGNYARVVLGGRPVERVKEPHIQLDFEGSEGRYRVEARGQTGFAFCFKRPQNSRVASLAEITDETERQALQAWMSGQNHL